MDVVNDLLTLIEFSQETENVDVANAIINTVERLLPFSTREEHDKWCDVVCYGTGEQIIAETKKILL